MSGNMNIDIFQGEGISLLVREFENFPKCQEKSGNVVLNCNPEVIA